VLPFTRFGTIHAIDPQSDAVGLPALDPNGSGNDGGAPLALGLLGALPIAAGRRRVRRREADLDAFLPTLSCDPFRYRS